MGAQQETSTALKKVGSNDIKSMLSGDQFKEAIKASLPAHITPDRFVRVGLTALMRTPGLAQCTKESFFKAMLDLSSLGLEPDGRRAHLIPYRNNKNNTMEVQLIIDYKGLIELAKRSGEVSSIRAELVCEKDFFSWENGVVTHKVDFLKPRGKTLAVYSHVKNSNGVDEYEIMTLDQVAEVRKRSKARDSGPWVSDFDEMAKKTVIRRHSKRLTLSPEFADALEKDQDKSIDADDINISFEDLMPKRASELNIEAPKQEQDPIKKEDHPKDEAKTVESLSKDERDAVYKLATEMKLPHSEVDKYCTALFGVNLAGIKSNEVEGVKKWIRSQKPGN